MYIQRNLEATIRRYLAAPEIIAVVGPRQSGKTTMIRHCMEGLDGAQSLSFDDQQVLTMFERATDDFITAYVRPSRYLFIDEFQYAKNGGKILKYIVDREKTKIIISGSSVLDLTVKAVKYLVGRILVFSLYPFDFGEFLQARDDAGLQLYRSLREHYSLSTMMPLLISSVTHAKLMRAYEEYLLFGGYPRVVLENDPVAKHDILRNIYNTYFLREVRDTLGLIDDYKLQVLLKALALQIGNLISYNELSRVSDYSYPSLKKYLHFLERTYLCQFVRPFYRNKRTEIVKNPKVYFFDTGIRNSIVNDFRPVGERPDGGALLENGLAMQFAKEGIPCNFWRDKKQHEVDFLLTLEGNAYTALESKSLFSVTPSSGVKAFRKAYPAIPVHASYVERNEKYEIPIGAYPIYLY